MQAIGRKAELALCLAVALCRLLVIPSFPIYDDAFITYRYAENLAHGAGLVFNPGAPWEPVLGTTTPAYALLLALPTALGANVIGASLAINLVCDVLSAWLMLALLRQRPLAALVAVAAFAAVPQLGRVSVGGMEAPLFLMLALAATHAARAGRLSLAGTCAALDCVVRPEAVLLVGILGLVHLRSWRDALRFLAPVAAIGVVSAGSLTAVYGNPIPQSVRAKAGSHGLGLDLRRIALVLRQAFGPALPLRLLGPLVALGFWSALVRRARAGESSTRAIVGFALAMLATYVVSGAKTWGWYFYVPLAAWCIGLGLGVDVAVRGLLSSRLPWIERRARPAAFGAALAALAATFGLSRFVRDGVTPTVYRAMAEWGRESRVAESGARLFSSDIGAIAFYTGARILDAEGLVWPEGKGLVYQLDVLRATRPEYVMCVVNTLRLARFVEDPIAADYDPIRRFNATGDRDLRPDLAQLSDAWSQDYILFQRR